MAKEISRRREGKKMDTELSVARKKEEGWSELLARIGDRVSTEESQTGDSRSQEPRYRRRYERSKIKNTKTKGESSSKTKRTHPGSSKPKGYRRDNKSGKQNREDEGRDISPRRSAKELGIVFDTVCSGKAHFWVESERVFEGSLFQCRYCHNYIWLPTQMEDAAQLSNLLHKGGKDEGYCHYLNHKSRRGVKVLLAKMQALWRLSSTMSDSVEFAKIADKIINDKEYDRKEVEV